MTPEEKEKAKEIAMINSRCYGYGLNCDSTDDCYQSALLAMQWKDKQSDKEKQKLIDEACKWLERNDSYAVPTNVQVDRLREHLNNIK